MWSKLPKLAKKWTKKYGSKVVGKKKTTKKRKLDNK